MKKPSADERAAKIAKRLSNATDMLSNVGKEDFAWKPMLADAMLATLAATGRLEVADLRAELARRADRPVMIAGTDFKIEAARMASETAIAHLDRALADREAEGREKD